MPTLAMQAKDGYPKESGDDENACIETFMTILDKKINEAKPVKY